MLARLKAIVREKLGGVCCASPLRAAEKGHIECLAKQADEVHFATGWHPLTFAAVKNNHLHMVKYMHEAHNACTVHEYAIDVFIGSHIDDNLMVAAIVFCGLHSKMVQYLDSIGASVWLSWRKIYTAQDYKPPFPYRSRLHSHKFTLEDARKLHLESTIAIGYEAASFFSGWGLTDCLKFALSVNEFSEEALRRLFRSSLSLEYKCGSVEISEWILAAEPAFFKTIQEQPSESSYVIERLDELYKRGSFDMIRFPLLRTVALSIMHQQPECPLSKCSDEYSEHLNKVEEVIVENTPLHSDVVKYVLLTYL